MKDPMKLGKPGVNYYALLGVPSTATPEEITKAFRKKILQVHLDKMGPDDDTEVCYLTIEAHRILSDKALRQKYDVERSSSKDYKAQEEKFIPAGYICYDVGHNQMSRQLLDSITNWTSEYDKCASELSDNYFNCFSQIMAQVMGDENDDGGGGGGGGGGSGGGGSDKDKENGEGGTTAQQGFLRRKKRREQQIQNKSHYYCPVCDNSYVTETHHWDSIINPYRAMFFSDQQGIHALNMYFQGLIGQNMFEWELRYLPTRLLGIWGSSEWSTLSKLHQQTVTILKQCEFQAKPDTGEDDSIKSSAAAISKLEKMLESSSSKNASFTSAQNAFLRRSLIQNIIWVLENRDQTVEQMMSRMNELIMQDDLQEIMCLGMAMRNVLKFQSSEWEQLIQDALTQENFEMAMLWTMLAVESGDKKKGDWFQLGMTIRGMGDAVLAHFCFLLAGWASQDSWEELADLFTENGAHYAAIEYHLNRGNLFQLLSKSKSLKRVDPESAAIYSGIFYATRVKGLLQVLRKRSRTYFSETATPKEAYNEEMEELIEIIQDLGGNPLEGFRIIVSTWPDVFEEAPGHWIHRASIQYLRKGRVNLKSQKLILAAVHFLPEDEAFEEICHVTKEASQLTRSMLERAQETNDFEMLTDVLLHLNKRTLSSAEEYLAEIRPPTPVPVASEKEEKIEVEEGETPPPPPPPQAPPPAPEPSHKSAMYLLLRGTIHKIHESWLDAMKDYQTALLTAPEVMHRVLPCVSKLVQDIQFHEAVISQVQSEVQNLQESLLNKQYPNVDEFSSDKRRSLILTDVSPIMDYGYKDSVSKIQQNPDNIPPPPPPEEEPEAPPPPPANTPMVTLDRNQEAIQTGQQDGQMDQLSAALAYVDLLKALPLPMHPGPIVMAASHFLRAMDDNANPSEIGKLYAYRNAIMLMAENLLRVDKKLQHTIHHGLTHKHMLSILLSAHEKLSKALAKKNDSNDVTQNEDESSSPLPTPNEPVNSNSNDKVNNDEETDEENNNKNLKKNKKDLIRKTEAHVISKFFQNVVNFPKVEPLASIPTLNCSDLVYVETLGNSFLSQFCADKVSQKHQSPLIPKHLHAYTHFVEVWKGRSTLSDFPQARVKAMEELLALNGWTMGDVQRKMLWPFLTFQQDGYSPSCQCLLQLRDPIKSYRSIDGFQINYETGSVDLLMSRDPMNSVDTLFDLHDIRDVVGLCKSGLDRLVFSLETPVDGGVGCSHPFKEARFSTCGQGQGQNKNTNQQKIISQIPESVMATLSRVSMLLCYLASGLEMCSETPFWMRRTDEGLLHRLDEHLQHLARPITWRKAERRESEKSPFETETVGKFWLNMIEIFEEIEEEDEGQNDDDDDDQFPIVSSRQLTYRVGQMRTEIRPNTLVMTLDPKRRKQRLSPEAEFCRDFTRHFSEFSRAFPELQRLEELVKISIVCSKLKQVLKENKALIQEHHSKNTATSKQSESKVKAVQRVCSIIERFLTLQNPEEVVTNSCNWYPATFCHNMDPDTYDVTAALELDPVVTYGPVPPSSKPIKVPLEKIIGLSGHVLEEEIDNVIEKEKVSPVVSVNSSEENGGDDEQVEVETDEEEEDDGEEEDEECVCGEERVNDNRNLSAVPEESEDSDESKEEVCCDVEEEEEDVSEYENNEEEMSADENDVAVAYEAENLESGGDGDGGSECEDIDSDVVSEEDAVAVEEESSESMSDGEEQIEEESCVESEERVEEGEEEEVPTLTIVIKRASIISQTSVDGCDTRESVASGSGRNENEEERECDGESQEFVNEDDDDEEGESRVDDENGSSDFPSENSDDVLMNDDNENKSEDAKKKEDDDDEVPDEVGFYSEEESENNDEVESIEEQEDGENENEKESTSESEEIQDERENADDDDLEEEETVSESESVSENPDLKVNKEDALSSSPTNNNSLLIEGKSAIKLRKVSVDMTSLDLEQQGQNQTKRAFLTRRGRLMVKLDTEKAKENIVSDSLEKTETDSEDGEFILAES